MEKNLELKIIVLIGSSPSGGFTFEGQVYEELKRSINKLREKGLITKHGGFGISHDTDFIKGSNFACPELTQTGKELYDKIIKNYEEISK